MAYGVSCTEPILAFQEADNVAYLCHLAPLGTFKCLKEKLEVKQARWCVKIMLQRLFSPRPTRVQMPCQEWKKVFFIKTKEFNDKKRKKILCSY